jgi:hypothetical protein
MRRRSDLNLTTIQVLRRSGNFSDKFCHEIDQFLVKMQNIKNEQPLSPTGESRRNIIRWRLASAA